jgi:AraC-like DNA-binding protein
MLSRSQRFLNQLESIIEEHLTDPLFTVTELSKSMNISEGTLRRKTQQYTSLSPNLFIRKFRLNKAIEMLENDVGTITEIAQAVGFCTPSYFSKCFQEQFGVVPSLYKREFLEKEQNLLMAPSWKAYEDN